MDGVIVGMFTSSILDCGLKPRLGQAKDYNLVY